MPVVPGEFTEPGLMLYHVAPGPDSMLADHVQLMVKRRGSNMWKYMGIYRIVCDEERVVRMTMTDWLSLPGLVRVNVYHLVLFYHAAPRWRIVWLGASYTAGMKSTDAYAPARIFGIWTYHWMKTTYTT